MANYLVTGGAGFIGSSLARRLVSMGHAVRVVDNLSTGFKSNLEEIAGRVEFVEGDVAEFAVCQSAVKGIDYVLHEAAIPSVQRSVDNPLRSNHANVTGTLNLLVAARDAKVKRLVFASSSSIYGDTEVLPKVETMPDNPRSPYALTKLAGEKYCVLFNQIYGFPAVALRYFNVFGPRQDPHSPYSAVISCFVDAAFAGKPPMVHGDGEQSRDFTFIDNVVDANLLACEAADVGGMVFNIGTGSRYTLNDLLRSLCTILGRALEPQHRAPRVGDVKHSQADISKARQYLGYEPKVSFLAGLERTVDWFSSQRRAGAEDRPS